MNLSDISLFSLEVAAEDLYLKPAVMCYIPMLGFRLLDYPTISVGLLTEVELSKIKKMFKENSEEFSHHCQIQQLQRQTGTYHFNKAKSCLFTNSVETFTDLMATIPLYVMVLDVVYNTPKLVGTACVSLEKLALKLKSIIVKSKSIDSACSAGEKDTYPLFNLMGSKVGEVSLGIKVSSLGKLLLQHISNTEIGYRPFSNDQLANLKPYSKHTPPINRQVVLENKVNRNRKNMSSQANISKNMHHKDIQFPIPPPNDSNTFYPPAMFYEKNDKIDVQKHSDKERIVIPTATKSNKPDKILYPSKYAITKQPVIPTQTEEKVDFAANLPNLDKFPILKALMKEVAQLTVGQSLSALNNATISDSETTAQIVAAEKSFVNETVEKPIPKQQKSKKNRKTTRPDKKTHDGPLRFGLTNTAKLRIQQVREAKQTQSSINIYQNNSPQINGTYTKRRPVAKKSRMISKAVGPNTSQLRRSLSHSQEIRAQTVFMEQLLSKHSNTPTKLDEATDADVPSIYPQSSEPLSESKLVPENVHEKLETEKTSDSHRAISRQSQRSIEIRMPAMSSEFPSEKDYTEDWTASSLDVEKAPDHGTGIESVDSQLSVKHQSEYSDDFDDERTGSPERLSVKSSRSFELSRESSHIADTSIEKVTSSAAFSSTDDDYKLNVYNMSDLPSPVLLKQHTSQESDSSASHGNSSIVTTLTANESTKTVKKINLFSIPAPIPSDSPVIHSLATTNGSVVESNDSFKLQNIDTKKAVKTKPESHTTPVKLPVKIGSPRQTMNKAFKPSPPSTRKSSPSSSKEFLEKSRMRYKHPGRRNYHSSSSSEMISPEPISRPPVNKSDSVSSYQPSEIPSDLSEIKMSEEIGNLSDILSEDSQGLK